MCGDQARHRYPNGSGKELVRPTGLFRRRDDKHAPVAVRELAMSLPASAWKTVRWRRRNWNPPFPFGGARAAPSRLLEQQTSPRGVAADRVAEARSRTDQVLVIYLARLHEPFRAGAFGQAALDH